MAIKTNWDLSHLYLNEELWNKDIKRLEQLLKSYEKKLAVMFNRVEEFISCYDIHNEVNILLEKVYCYPKRHIDLNSQDTHFQELFSNVLKIMNIVDNLNQQFEKNIVDNKLVINNYITDNKTKTYRRGIIKILEKTNHLSDDNAFYNSKKAQIKQSYTQLLNELDYKKVIINNDKVIVGKSNYNDLLLLPDQNERKKVYDAFLSSYIEKLDDITKLYIDKLNNDIELAQKEHYNSLLEKKLLINELPIDTIDVLIKKIKSNLSLIEEYTKYKKNTLKLSELHLYDTSLPLSNSIKREYDINEAILIIKNSLKVLGEDYLSTVDKAFYEGWIDVYPSDIKNRMNFTSLAYTGVPYINLNYQNNLSSIRTLAHELGHAIHTNYAKQNNYQNFDVNFFITEITAKVNELLVNNYLLEHVKEEKNNLLNNIISNIGNSLYNQTLLTEFEHTIITKLENNTLNKEDISEIYNQIAKEYNSDILKYDEISKYEWLKVPHFIAQESYYLYQYSIALAIAINIVNRLLNKESGIIEAYYNFLKAGNSLSVTESLALLNINLSYENYLDEAFMYLKKQLKKLK